MRGADNVIFDNQSRDLCRSTVFRRHKWVTWQVFNKSLSVKRMRFLAELSEFSGLVYIIVDLHVKLSAMNLASKNDGEPTCDIDV